MAEFLCWLPPNLQPPSSKLRVPVLLIKICDLAYVHLMGTKPMSIKYKWWGLHGKPIQQSLRQSLHKFPISVSHSMFLRYCTDMKILQFELCDQANVCLVKGHINFMLLKNWGGEEIDIVADLKHIRNNSKLGEIKLSLEVTQMENPIYKNPQVNIQRSTINKNELINNVERERNLQKMQQRRPQERRMIEKNTIKRPSNSKMIQKQQVRDESDLFMERRKPQEKHQQLCHCRRTQVLGRDRQNKQRFNQLDDTRTRLFKKLNLPLFQECICGQINTNKYNLQKIKLRTQIDLFFNQTFTDDADSLILEVIGWEALNKSDRSFPCRIILPILDAQGNIIKNQYNFGQGKGTIKVSINSKAHSQQKIKQYLISNNIQVIVGNSLIGSQPLSKIFGNRGEIISISMIEIKNKKQVLKGHCLMKLIKQSAKPTSSNINNQKQNNGRENNIKPVQSNTIKPNISLMNESNEPQYIWIYLRQFHFVQPLYFKDSNIYINIKSKQKQQFKSKTKWKTDSPVFNQIATVRLTSSQIMLEVWNRQATERLVGTAYLNMKENIKQYNMEIPAVDNYGRTIGYLALCMGIGDISSATQFLNTHAGHIFHPVYTYKPSNIQSEPYPPPSTGRRNEQNIEQIEEGMHHQQPQNPIRESQSEDSREQSHKLPQNSSHIHYPHPLKQQQELTILQIHNKIFTKYLEKDYDFFETYQNNQLSMAEFSHLLKPFCDSNNLIKLASVYFDSRTNRINLQQIKQSYDSFRVYYDILVSERDEALSQAIKYLRSQGVSINDVQNNVKEKVNQRRNSDLLWRGLKQSIQQTIVQKIRYFYEGYFLQQICDQLRKFEVYETTKGQQIPDYILSRQLIKQITELLQIDPRSSALRSAIKEAGLQLSKYELLSLFEEIPTKNKPTQMIKSPTFGLLGTQRMNLPPKGVNMLENPSIDIQMYESKEGESDLSSKFGHPRLSPINQKTSQNAQVSIKFSNIEQNINKIFVNEKQIQLRLLDKQATMRIQIPKQFNYEGYVTTMTNKILQFEGPAGEWIGLIDENGGYCGCICFQ